MECGASCLHLLLPRSYDLSSAMHVSMVSSLANFGSGDGEEACFL